MRRRARYIQKLFSSFHKINVHLIFFVRVYKNHLNDQKNQNIRRFIYTYIQIYKKWCTNCAVVVVVAYKKLHGHMPPHTHTHAFNLDAGRAKSTNTHAFIYLYFYICMFRYALLLLLLHRPAQRSAHHIHFRDLFCAQRKMFIICIFSTLIKYNEMIEIDDTEK